MPCKPPETPQRYHRHAPAIDYPPARMRLIEILAAIVARRAREPSKKR